MNTPIATLTTFLLIAGNSLAAEGVSPAWTQVADADATLMGDYEGVWLDAPKGHYYEINKPVAAQVVNVREGEYFLRFYLQHDARADAYFEGPGKLEGGEIRFAGNGWNGAITKDGLIGTATDLNKKTVKLELKKVTRSSPTLGMAPPPGAIVLFDGRNFDHWQHNEGQPVSWHITDGGAMEVRSAKSPEERRNGIGGDIRTKEAFGDCRVHIEFRYPVEPGVTGQGRGNSGFFLQDGYEVQILNSYGLGGMWNECGALYKTSPPKVNAARPPMEWQTYDIEYKASVWKDGRKVSAPRITVRHNGVLIHNDFEIPHATAHSLPARDKEPQQNGPLRLQDHSNAIQFRNIWIVPAKAE